MRVLSTDDYVVLRADLPQFDLHAGDIGMVREPRVSPLHTVEVEFLPPDADAPVRIPVPPEQIDPVPRISFDERSDVPSAS